MRPGRGAFGDRRPCPGRPPLLGYSGRLTSSAGGAPLVGPVDLTVALYDAAMGGAPLFSEAHDGTELIDGGSGTIWVYGTLTAQYFPTRY